MFSRLVTRTIGETVAINGDSLSARPLSSGAKKLKSTRLAFVISFSCLILGPLASTAWAGTSNPPIEAAADTYVVYSPNADTNYGTETTLIVKMGATSGSTSRATYIRFSYDPNYNWTEASLDLVVAGNFAGASDPDYGVTFTSFNLKVYGANDANWSETALTLNGATSTSQDWKLSTATVPWKFPNSEDLGSLSVPADPGTVGKKYSIANSALVSFLNNDSDGEVTFAIVRTDASPSSNLSFASKENTTYDGPTLMVPGADFKYAIAYDANGGSGTPPAQGEYVEGSPYTVLAPTSITPPSGKSFAGWNSKSDGTGTAYPVGSSYSQKSSVTLYAQYTSNPVVTFHSNDGNSVKSYQTVNSGVATALNANSFSRPGYSFSGWSTSAGSAVVAYTDESDITTSANKDLYAVWTADDLSVTYDSHGGSAISGGSVKTGASILSSPGTPTRAGYSFAGWFAEQSGGSALSFPYAHEQTADFTLHAQWTANDLSVTYDSHGGSAISGGSVKTGASILSSPGTPTRAGYSFAGWFAEQSGGSALSFPYAHEQTADFTLHAQWTADSHVVSFDANGGTAVADSSFYTDGTVSAPAKTTRSGHKLSGWSTIKDDASTKISFPYSPQVAEPITLYALWEIGSEPDEESGEDSGNGTGGDSDNGSGNSDESNQDSGSEEDLDSELNDASDQDKLSSSSADSQESSGSASAEVAEQRSDSIFAGGSLALWSLLGLLGLVVLVAVGIFLWRSGD